MENYIILRDQTIIYNIGI